MSVVSITERGAGWVLSLDRSPANAIDLSMVTEAERAITKAIASESCTSLVITGQGNVFSAGIDVRAVPNYSADELGLMIGTVNRLTRAVYGAAIPTVAAINGQALGVGLVLALACDVRIAAEGSYELGLTEAGAGVPFPACPFEVVRAELSADAARQLVLSSETFTASDVRANWFIDRIVSSDSLVAEALAEAAERTNLPAYAAVKQQLRGPVLACMDDIIEKNDDPLLHGWF